MLVNLALGERLDKRTGLASLRARRTSTVKGALRTRVYTTSLAQSEAMWAAAATTPALASPILRFYALLQAELAVIASSPLRNDEWQPKEGHGLRLEVLDDRPPSDDSESEEGHGLKIEVPKKLPGVTASLAKVIVKPHGRGAAQKLGDALGSVVLQGPVPLLDLIAALPCQSLLTELGGSPILPLSVTPNPTGLPGEGPVMRWNHPPHDVVEAVFDDPASSLEMLRNAFAPYPKLAALPRIIGANPVTLIGSPEWIDVVFEPEPDPNDSSWFSGKFLPQAFWDGVIDVWRSPLPLVSGASGLVLPPVGGNERAQHPLVTWHLVLYAFSMLARYHSPYWSELLDFDTNPDARPLRLLVDEDSQEALMFVELAILGFLADEAASARPPVDPNRLGAEGA